MKFYCLYSFTNALNFLLHFENTCAPQCVIIFWKLITCLYGLIDKNIILEPSFVCTSACAISVGQNIIMNVGWFMTFIQCAGESKINLCSPCNSMYSHVNLLSSACIHVLFCMIFLIKLFVFVIYVAMINKNYELSLHCFIYTMIVQFYGFIV